jgi:hypothetical protein
LLHAGYQHFFSEFGKDGAFEGFSSRLTMPHVDCFA